MSSPEPDYAILMANVSDVIRRWREGHTTPRKALGDVGAIVVRGFGPRLAPGFRARIATWLAGHDTPGPDAVIDPLALAAIDATAPHLIEAVAAGLDAIGEPAGAAP